MAPKKPNPMEEPPAASSSEDEESSSDEVTSSDEEEAEEPTKPSSPPQQTQKSTHSVASTPQSKSYSSEEDSESESDSDPESTPKPIATKPMEETPKAATTKPRSKAPAKRPNEPEESLKDSKRAKKKETHADPDLDDEDQKKPGEDMKKQLFQRLWSEEDEIAVLKGLIDFTTKKGMDPYQDTNAFHDFIKKLLHVDVTKTQVMDKIRRLKKKYENNLGRGKKGEDRTFSKLHERQAYDLSKKLWGNESTSGVLESAAKSNGKSKKNQNQKGSSKSLFKAELNDGAKEGEKMDIDNDKKGSLSSAKEMLLFDKCVGMAGLEEFVINQGLDIIGGAKKAELEERWKKLQIAQLQLFVERNDLIKEQTKFFLEAMKSSGH
ncbi:GLABROUS1 enhancer-binding protein-like [Pistacia vera]|uniref:GLABROUS1 enhancer-binding protein-like n=1 Tax=Pistacia vera TaxID=55513 RepID=UPI001263A94A|nr:GLABROUS1 enhancer-binding protein-like [Pistacia vera]